MKLSGQSVPTEHILLGAIVDRLSTLVWFKTKNGQNGVNRPKSVVESMLGLDKNENSEVMAFDTADGFRKKWESLTERKGE